MIPPTEIVASTTAEAHKTIRDVPGAIVFDVVWKAYACDSTTGPKTRGRKGEYMMKTDTKTTA